MLMLGAVACFAALDATAKWVNRSADPLQTVALRYLGSFMLVSTVCNPWARVGFARTRSLGLQGTRSLCLVTATVCSFYALRHLPLMQATSITFASPLMVAMIAGPVLGEWPGPHRIGAVAAGFVGVLVVTRPWSGGLQPAVVLAFGTACANAAYSILTRLLAARDSSLTTLFYTGVFGALAVLPVLPLLGVPHVAAGVWLAIAALGVFGTIGHWLLILAHRRAPASMLAPFSYAQLVGPPCSVGWRSARCRGAGPR